LRVSLGKVKRDAHPDQLISFTSCLRQALPIQYGDLPSAARNQAGTGHAIVHDPWLTAQDWEDREHFPRLGVSRNYHGAHGWARGRA
jgi:hypothetical protein